MARTVQMGPQGAALIVIDMQNGFCHQEGSFTKMGADMQTCIDAIAPCRRLIDGAHDAGIPVIFTQNEWRADYTDAGLIADEILGRMAAARALVTKTWDAQIVDELAPEERDYVIYKVRFSGFCGTSLDLLLPSLRVDTLIVCGVTTCTCVESTVRDAAQHNYRCIVVPEAVAAPDRTMHDASLRAMEYAYAALVDIDRTLAAWSTGAAIAAVTVHDHLEFARNV